MPKIADPVFIDTNVLIYARFATASLHSVSVGTLDGLAVAGNRLWVSRQILREYLAAVTRPQSFAAPLPIALASADVLKFEQAMTVADETSAVTAHLLQIVSQFPCGGKQIHDANIVATMLAFGVSHLLTNNGGDFSRFGALITVLPLVPPPASPPIPIPAPSMP